MHIIRVTERFAAGFPDCLYTYKGSTGLVELKSLPSWPKRETTTTNFGIRPEQSIWLRNWHKNNNNSWVFVKIGDDWLLFSSENIVELYQGVTKERAYQIAILQYYQDVNWKELRNKLSLCPRRNG